MDRIRYVLAVLLVATMPPGVIWWYMVHPFVDFWRRLGPRATMWIVGASMLSLTVFLGTQRARLLGADLGTNWYLVGGGIALIGVGVVMGVKRRKYLTRRILAGIPELNPAEAGKLLCEGPYAMIRHPRYVEVVVALLGNAMVVNYVGAYVVAALLVPALHLVVLLEERELRDRFGAEYEAYCARVPRYLPRLARRGTVS